MTPEEHIEAADERLSTGQQSDVRLWNSIAHSLVALAQLTLRAQKDAKAAASSRADALRMMGPG